MLQKKINNFTYNNFENIIVSKLKRLSSSELNEEKHVAEICLQHMQLYNFDNFMSIRLGYYAITFAIIAFIFGSQDLLNELLAQLHFSQKGAIGLMCSAMAMVLIGHNLTSYKQKEDIIYYGFKLKCIEKVINQRENNKKERDKK